MDYLGCAAQLVAVENPRDARVGEARRAGRTLRATGDTGTPRRHPIGTTDPGPAEPRRVAVALPEGIFSTVRVDGAPFARPERARGAYTVVAGGARFAGGAARATAAAVAIALIAVLDAVAARRLGRGWLTWWGPARLVS